MTSLVRHDLVRRADLVMRPDPGRVLAKLFVPGQELTSPGVSRAAAVIHRCLAMSDAETREALERLDSFTPRHRDYQQLLRRHFEAVRSRPDLDAALSVGLTTDQQRLIGAYFTQEYALEAAALFNPSVVAHPIPDPDPARLRFVMSARAVGEGHISSIVFLSGTFTESPEPTVLLDPRSPWASHGSHRAGSGDDRTYSIEFDPATDLSERTLGPVATTESNGVEDARFVRFTDGGSSTYLGTYTAFDGARIASARFRTDDFLTFHASPFTGHTATNKGMALFPRRIGGRYLAVSRWDRENNAIASSADGVDWDEAVTVQRPRRPWEVVQLGNCGSPIETAAGWLVLTHGVGAMREYAIGAVLLDLDDPTRVIAHLDEPLLRPDAEERNGYVPNVVYSCGAIAHGRTLLLPYGCSDSSIRMAFVDLPGLIDRLAGLR